KPSFAVELQRGPLSLSERASKRALDLFVALMAILLLMPVMLFAALAIWLDSPGPVLFRQRRHGFNAKPFYIFKFRTMFVAEDGDRIIQATRSDQRITRVGRILRRSSLDELPQLVNVLRGEMSLVGPRPHAVSHNSQYSRVLEGYAL